MNKLLKKLSLVFVGFMLAVFSSCGEPDRWTFTVGGSTYGIDKVTMTPVDYDDDYYQICLTMEGSGNGKLATLSYMLYSDVNMELPSGTYSPSMHEMHLHHKFEKGEWSDGEIVMPIYVGKVKVKHNKDGYHIDIEGNDKKGHGVVAEYKGTIEII